MSRLGIMVLVAAGLCGPARATGQVPSDTALVRSVDSMARAMLASGPVAGMSILVRRGSHTIVDKGYGLADVENGVAATPQSVYRIGSITKQFTAAAVMQLAEQGKLSLDDDITKYLPTLPVQGRHVLIRQLLNHTSGIKSYTGLGPRWFRLLPLELSPDSIVGLVAHEPFDFEPGTNWRYDNTGYVILGMLIEKASGQKYADYLRDHVTGPLGLSATVYCDERPIIPHRATGYEVESGKLVNDTPIHMSQPFAAGALCSTTGDLASWSRALAGGRVVSAASYARMSTPDTLTTGRRLAYGFGLGAGELEGHHVVSHGGGIPGFVSMLATYPADSLTVVVLVTTEGPAADLLAGRIARRALGIRAPVVRAAPLTPGERAAVVGTYRQGADSVRVYEAGGKLMMAEPHESPVELIPIAGGRLMAAGRPDDRLTFEVTAGRMTLRIDYASEAPFRGERVGRPR